MIFSENRDDLRQFYVDVWRKTKNSENLEPLEAIVSKIIEMHSEYHSLLDNSETAKSKEFSPDLGEGNPFAHMGLHIGIHEQLTTHRPPELKGLYQKALLKLQDPHAVEHLIMNCLADMVWVSQKNGTPFNEKKYVKCVKGNIKNL